MTWRPFPSDDLLESNSVMVESLHSWIARQSARCGYEMRSIYESLGLPSSSRWPSVMDGISPLGAHAIEMLAGLTNSPTIRRGTLYSFHLVAGRGFQGHSPQRLRWCPMCLTSKLSELYQPLIFTLKACSVCPLHGCDILELCPSCNSAQWRSWHPSKWSTCHKCHGALAAPPTFSKWNRYELWTQAQCEHLVEFFCIADREIIDGSSLTQFLERVTEPERERKRAIGFFSLARGLLLRRCGLTLPNLMMLAAGYGTSVVEILHRPLEAAAHPLFPPWRCKRSIDTITRLPELEIVVQSIALDHLWFKENGYVPDSSTVARALGITSEMIEDLGASAWSNFDYFSSRCTHPHYYSITSALPLIIKDLKLRLDGKVRPGSVMEMARASRVPLRKMDDESIRTICTTALRIASRVSDPYLSSEEFESVFARNCSLYGISAKKSQNNPL